MKLISLFSGIGGFELASEWMGWKNIVSCEINDFGQKVLKHYWPNAYHHDDIHTLTIELINKKLGNDWRTNDVILTGGFPCQPYSLAGQRLGKEDSRHLWPEMLRAIREIQPRWVVGENVYGLVNWNGGVVFNEVQADLEAEGYEVQPYVIPACAVNAPHRRDRIWFVAFKNTNNNGRKSNFGEKESSFGQFGNSGTGNNERISPNDGEVGVTTHPQRTGLGGRIGTRKSILPKSGSEENDVANSERIGQSGQRWSERQGCSEKDRNWKASWSDADGGWPLESPVCGRNDGVPSKLVGITVSKHRNESLKAYGNAIVPQVALQIFKAIQKYEESISNT